MGTYATGKYKGDLTCIDGMNINLASLDVYLKQYEYYIIHCVLVFLCRHLHSTFEQPAYCDKPGCIRDILH